MKLIRSCLSNKEMTISEALEDRLKSRHDYYGNRQDDAMRDTEELVTIVSELCEILFEKGILDKENILDIVGSYSYEIVEEDDE